MRVAGEDFAVMSSSDPTLLEQLTKVEPAKLVRLLAELATQDQTVLEQVQFLLASGDAGATMVLFRQPPSGGCAVLLR